ncbi:Hint domain-containing protein [Roseovarius litoreus]|jgi:hypothetical protein|uniref:Hint domain-containing protein n=1 Tax=Roseovarius litoreus TaxID=1155722 RepID=A0A1M7IIJ1_9RHOB|nr:Hint domain-containing protein [Roseovarius litoreus]SHM40622.1 Hint domain-containing protein [Roseovarius litoreus]
MKPKTVGRINGGQSTGNPNECTGLMAQSIILTLDGEKLVGDVKPGDRIVTRDSGMAVLRKVHQCRIQAAAVHIAAGSLGHTRPDRDVTLPAGQMVLIRDWRAEALFGTPQALVPAERLVDGEFVRFEDAVWMTLCTLEFDRPHILYVDGIEVAGHVAAEATSAAA